MTEMASWLSAALCAFALLLGEAHAARLALVMGNDSYAGVERLRNARADARAVAEALRQAGFAVEVAEDQDRAGMNRTLRRFRQKLGNGDDVVFFYAGHGVELSGSNYLLPVDIKADDEEQVRDDAIALQEVLDALRERRPRFTLAIVDACRDNPLKAVGRNLGERGLKPVTAATGQMVIYSAGAGQKALDRLGDEDRASNGVFTRVFVREMLRSEEPVQTTMSRVRREVSRLAASVGREQVPALYDQSVGEFQFLGGGKREAVPGGGAGAPKPKAVEVGDLAQWQQWQSQLEADFAKLAGLGLKGRMAVEAWERFLRTHGEDNPYTEEDDRLRGEAKRRVDEAKAAEPRIQSDRSKENTEPKRPAEVQPAGEVKRGSMPAGQVFRDCPECPEMVVIPAGEFEMGSHHDPSEQPQRRVRVGQFAIGKYELTQGQWRAVMGTNPSSHARCGDDCPVERVGWRDAKAFIRKLNEKVSGNAEEPYRLPSEAEWEYACRGSVAGQEYCGSNDPTAVAHFDSSLYGVARATGTQQVGRKSANRFGLHDMSGNVAEWVEDCWNGSYRGAPEDGRAWTAGDCSWRVYRGGEWNTWNEPSYPNLRSARRFSRQAVTRDNDTGFRLARTLP